MMITEEQSTGFTKKVLDIISNNEDIKKEYEATKLIIMNDIDTGFFHPEKIHIHKVKSLAENIIKTYNEELKQEYRELELSDDKQEVLRVMLVSYMITDLEIDNILTSEYKRFIAKNVIDYTISKISNFSEIKEKFNKDELLYRELEKPEEPKSSSYGFHIQWNNKREFEQVLKSVGTLVDEAHFEVNGNGLTVRTMDSSHVGLIDVLLPKDNFVSFSCDDWRKFAINVQEALKVLTQIESNEELMIKENPLNNTLELHNNEGFSYELKLLEPFGGNTPVPKLTFNSEFIINEKIIKTLVKRSQIAEYFTITTTDNSLVFSNKDDLGEFKQAYDYTSEGLEELKVKDDSLAAYSTEYLIKLFKSFTSLKLNKVKFEYSTKMPLKLSVDVGFGGYINFYLAPRIQD